MQSVEMYFIDTIEKHNLFKQAATSLLQEVPTLTPADVYQRCINLSAMQKELTENKEQFFVIMEFMGSGMLDTASVGEFQRALDESIIACDKLYAEILGYKHNLASPSHILC